MPGNKCLENPDRRLIRSRLEVYSMKFIKNKKNNNCNNDDNNNNNNNATEFKGTIYIADGVRTHDMYNSEKENEYKLLYTELPWKNYLKRRRVYTLEEEEEGEKEEDEEEELPVMGPHLALFITNYCLVIVHNDTGDATEEKLALGKCVFPWLGKGENYYVKHLDFGDPLKICNIPFDVQVDCPFRSSSLKLKCIFFEDSKVVRVQVMWIPHQKPGTDTDTHTHTHTDAAADDIYILGKIALSFSSPAIDPRESILLKTPTNKAIKAYVKQPIPLLKSVVAIPYRSDFKITADLVARPANIDEVNDDSAATVNGHVDFSDPRVDECPDAFFEGVNLPGFNVKPADEDDYFAKLRLYDSGYFYESMQLIPGEGADIKVTVIVDVQ